MMSRTDNSVHLTREELSVIREWISDNGIKIKDARLLIEAYRRFHSFNEDNEPLSAAWLGLGDEREYGNSPYFTLANSDVFATKPIPRWWKLTERGCLVLSSLNTRLPWRKQMAPAMFGGEVI